jgi:hypothetical protein
MNRIAAFLLIAIVCAGALPQREAAAQEAPNGCAHFWGEARRISGSAFSHVVHVENTCKANITCSVSTDVRPQATNIHVGPGQRVELNTYLSSPYSEFTPRVDCDLSK